MNLNPVHDFMVLGGQIQEGETFPPGSYWINRIAILVDDEVTETFVALDEKNLVEALDGFIDTAYVALTGAIALVGLEKAQTAWDRVVDANLSKVDGRFGPAIIDDTGKIQKPEGWQPPNYDFLNQNKED